MAAYVEKVTFTDNSLQLGRFEVRLEPDGADARASADDRGEATNSAATALADTAPAATHTAPAPTHTAPAPTYAPPAPTDTLPGPTETPSDAQAAEDRSGARFDLALTEPGLADLEAAVELVSANVAKRVVLSGFQPWPGLLWRAYELAETVGVQILPDIARPGGTVDLVITRAPAVDG